MKLSLIEIVLNMIMNFYHIVILESRNLLIVRLGQKERYIKIPRIDTENLALKPALPSQKHHTQKIIGLRNIYKKSSFSDIVIVSNRFD